MLKLTSFFIILVALLVSTNFCLRNSFPAHPRGPPPKVLARTSKEAAYRPPSPWQEAGQRHPFQHKDRTFIKNSSQSVVKYTLKGTELMQSYVTKKGSPVKQNYQMEGQVYASDGSSIGQWGLYKISGVQILRGWVRINEVTYLAIALFPDDSSKDTQALIYSRDKMVQGTIVVKPADNDGKVKGQATLDPSNTYPIFRCDIKKKTLKGVCYLIVSSQLDKSVTGGVEIKHVSGDKFEGVVYQQNDGWYCQNKFSFKDAHGFDTKEFVLDLQGHQCYPGTRSSLLAKVDLSSNTSNMAMGKHAKVVKLNETDQYITYGQVPY